MRSLILSQCRDLRIGVTWQNLGALTTAWAREFWIIARPICQRWGWMNDLCQAVFFATSDAVTSVLLQVFFDIVDPSSCCQPGVPFFDLITRTSSRRYIQFSVHVRPDVPTPVDVLPTPSFRFPFLLLISAIYRSQVFVSAVRTLRQSLRSEKNLRKLNLDRNRSTLWTTTPDNSFRINESTGEALGAQTFDKSW